MPLSPACSTVLCICAKKLQNVQVKLLCTGADYHSDCEATKKKMSLCPSDPKWMISCLLKDYSPHYSIAFARELYEKHIP